MKPPVMLMSGGIKREIWLIRFVWAFFYS